MAGSPVDPSFQFSTVTPSDTKTLTYHSKPARAKAFYISSISGGAALAVKDDAGTTVTFNGLVAGTVLPVSSDTVTTATTATVIALF